MTKYEIHPLAKIFPSMQEAELQELVTDIQTNGLLEPLTIYEDKILDGRNRYKACQIANVEPTTKPYKGLDPLTYVIARNLHRRHLTASQRAALAVELIPMIEEQARQRQATRKPKIVTNVTESTTSVTTSTVDAKKEDLAFTKSCKSKSPLHTAKTVGKIVKVNPDYIQKAKTIQETKPALLDAVKDGRKNIKTAWQEATQPKKEAKKKELQKQKQKKYKEDSDYKPEELQDIHANFGNLTRYIDNMVSDDSYDFYAEVSHDLDEPLTDEEQRQVILKALSEVIKAYFRLDDYEQRIVAASVLNPTLSKTDLSQVTGIRRDYSYRVFDRIEKKEPMLAAVLPQIKHK